jgi:Zn-dependent peptidase ImmA (M78 family)
MESKSFMLDFSPEAVRVINRKVNELLFNYDDLAKDMSVDPSVDINRIANACGIKEVKYVSPDQLDGEHAVFKDGVVKIDETDTEGQRIFDLAHEVGHIVFNHITKFVELKINLPDRGENSDFALFTTSLVYEAARQGARKKSELPPEEQRIEDFFFFFAANLLIPIDRFQLWEDKSDKEIAEAFKVEEKCIKKRRQEVEIETGILTETMKPCPTENVIDPDVKLDIEAMVKEVNSQ